MTVAAKPPATPTAPPHPPPSPRPNRLRSPPFGANARAPDGGAHVLCPHVARSQVDFLVRQRERGTRLSLPSSFLRPDRRHARVLFDAFFRKGFCETVRARPRYWPSDGAPAHATKR